MKSSIFGAAVVIALSSSFALASDWNSSSALDRANQAHDARENCTRLRYPFVLNKANVNALVALSCAGLSHVENERRDMNYENGSTMFHQWQTTGSSSQIHVKGYCAVPLPDLKDNKFDRHQIDLNFTSQNIGADKIKVTVEGQIAGKSMSLEFTNNSFLDNECPGGEANFSRLQSINLGTSGGMQDVIDMLRSKRSGVSMQLLEQENWLQGSTATSFDGLGLQYRMAQANSRQIGLAATASPSGSVLEIRSANVLDYYEAGNYFALKNDEFGQTTGFQDTNLPSNHKFQTASIAGGSQIIGCSALIYNSELDRSEAVDMDTCKLRIAQSGLDKFAERSWLPDDFTPEEQQEIARRSQEKAFAQKALDLLNMSDSSVKNYSDRPNTYETGRAAWTKADVARGFVVQQRTLKVDIQKRLVIVTEFRSNTQGVKSKKVYSKSFAQLGLK